MSTHKTFILNTVGREVERLADHLGDATLHARFTSFIQETDKTPRCVEFRYWRKSDERLQVMVRYSITHPSESVPGDDGEYVPDGDLVPKERIELYDMEVVILFYDEEQISIAFVGNPTERSQCGCFDAALGAKTFYIHPTQD